MAEFSQNDISEAKRRVKEMQERARSYQADAPPEENKNAQKEEKKENAAPFGLSDILGDLTSGDDSSKGLILALILILAKEKADNMLILALLYILL